MKYIPKELSSKAAAGAKSLRLSLEQLNKLYFDDLEDGKIHLYRKDKKELEKLRDELDMIGFYD